MSEAVSQPVKVRCVKTVGVFKLVMALFLGVLVGSHLDHGKVNASWNNCVHALKVSVDYLRGGCHCNPCQCGVF